MKLGNARALLVFSLSVLGAVPACGSSGSGGTGGLASPGSPCDGTSPMTCGALAKGGAAKDVVLFCRNGTYESVLDCKPSGSGLTNRCFAGGSSTIVDCFDEPSEGKVTRCEASGAGTSLTYACNVGTMGAR